MRRTFDVNIYREHFPAVLTKATDGQYYCNWKNLVSTTVAYINNLNQLLALGFILALCIRIHVYTVHTLVSIRCPQYFLK